MVVFEEEASRGVGQVPDSGFDSPAFTGCRQGKAGMCVCQLRA